MKIKTLFILILISNIINILNAKTHKVKILSVTVKVDNNITIYGKCKGYNLNISIPDSDTLTIILESKNSPSSKYPSFSDYVSIGKNCTIYHNRCLTRQELYGVDITKVSLYSKDLRKAPVWYSYGGLSKWQKNAPDSVTINFKYIISDKNLINKLQGKEARIHAIIKQVRGGPFSAWKSFVYAHDAKSIFIGQVKSDYRTLKNKIKNCKKVIQETIKKIKVLKDAKDNALMQVSGATPSYYQNIVDDYNALINIQKYRTNYNYVLYEYSPLDRSVYLSSLIKMYQDNLKAQKNYCKKLENRLKRLQK